MALHGDADHDSAVMQTASDASLCKLSASNLGYYVDPYVQYFVKAPSRRMPLINRGYYARVASVESLVTKFVQRESCDSANGNGDATTSSTTSTNVRSQVVMLGAGLDTMFFRLQKAGVLDATTTYFELDFPDVTRAKVSVIRRRKELSQLLGFNTSQELQQAVSLGTSLTVGRPLGNKLT